jgi:hypothetical protein
MSDYIYRVMPEVAPGVFLSRALGGSPGFTYRLGEWTPRVENPRLCERGYHTLAPAGLLEYVSEGDAIVRCKRRGCGEGDDKKATNASIMPVEIVGYATSTALRLTAADSAESVLHIYHKQYPDDLTLEVVIHTVRAFALGGATREDLAAAWDAAWAAARAASRDSAEAAARHAARAAAWAAAWTASRDAAEAAAEAASRDASRAAAEAAAEAAAGKSLLFHAKEGVAK